MDRLVILALFLPVLAGQSGNTGCQALAVTLRGITLGELKAGKERALVLKEASLGFMNGAFTGLVAAIGMFLVATHQNNPNALVLAAVVWLALVGKLRRERHLRRDGAAHAEALRRRSRDRLQHLPDHGDRRRQHGAAAGACHHRSSRGSAR